MMNKPGSMSNISTTYFTNNLQYLMKKNKITSVGLSESVGVSAELIGKLKNGGLSNPSLKVLAGISRHFKVSMHELVFGDLKNLGDNLLVKPISYIPVVDWKKIQNWKSEPATASVLLENVPSENLFALHIENDYAVFQKDSFVFVNTAHQPKTNDYVLVLNKENQMFSIKKLIIEDAYYLQSAILDINTVTKYNEQDSLIYGVIIGYQKTKLF